MKHVRTFAARTALGLILALPMIPLFAAEPSTAAQPTPNVAGFVTEVTANEQADKASLYVETDIAKAEVYLNGIYKGLTPLTIDPIGTGLWQLTLKKDGYYQQSYTIEMIAGDLTKIYAVLKPVTGTLTVQNAPAGAEFEIDGKVYQVPTVELSEGSHMVVIKAFGYVEKKTSVAIHRRTEKLLDGTLERAAFAVTGLGPARASFNPENPGNLGKCAISFSVTAPGSGTISILDAAGTIVKSDTLGPFTTWQQSLSWDGSDAAGQPAPDGDYRIVLQLTPAIPGEKIESKSSVRIDRSLVYPLTDSFTGIGATGPVISAATMPKRGVIVHFDCLAVPDAHTFNPGVSSLIGFTDRLEGGFRAALLVGKNNQTAFDLDGGLKLALTGGPLRTALSLRYSASPDSLPALASPFRRGLAFAPAVEYQLGHLSIGADAVVCYGNAEGLFTDAFFTTAGGLACRYTAGPVSGALWGQYETGDSPTTGTAFGASFQWLLPATNLALSGQAGYLLGEAGNDLFFWRAGFGVMF